MAACPICARPVEAPQFRPFCSARCKQVDLGRWFGETYRIPVSESEAQSEDAQDAREKNQ